MRSVGIWIRHTLNWTFTACAETAGRFFRQRSAMIRKVAVATLIAAFISATTPGFACTGISLKAQDGAAIRGRTLEFGFPMQSNVIVVPAGKEMGGTLPDGGKGLTYTSRYAIVGANALNLPAILDGINDQGLSVGLFYFPNYARYTEVTPENAKHAI